MIRLTIGWLALGSLSVIVGCSGGEPGLAGVQGTVMVDSAPAAPGTRVKFRHVDDQSSFVAIVEQGGNYAYHPPAQAPLKRGSYQVSVEPIASTSTVDETGMAVETATPGAIKSYGKSSDPTQSGLDVVLADEPVTFDIDITSR